MIIDKELLTALIAIFGVALYDLLHSSILKSNLPEIPNCEIVAVEMSSDPDVVENNCTICDSNVLYSGSYLTRCEHWFHKGCFENCLDQWSERCPDCRNFATSNVNEEAKEYLGKALTPKNLTKFMKYLC